MPDKNPIRWKLVVWMNLAMLGGCIVAAFTLPPSTRLSIFGFSCLVCVIGFNVALYFRGYRRAESKDAVETSEKKRSGRNLAIMSAVIWIYLLWQIGSRYWWK